MSKKPDSRGFLRKKYDTQLITQRTFPFLPNMGPTSAEYIIFLSFPRLIYERLFLADSNPFYRIQIPGKAKNTGSG